MVGGGWLELERDEEPLTDAEIEICDGGIAKLDADAQRVVLREFQRNFIFWFIGGSIIGVPLLFIPLIMMRQRLRHVATPRQAGMWIGVLFGISLWCLVFASVARYISLSTWRYLVQATGLVWSYVSFNIGLIIRREYYNLVDPGPANQIFGMRNMSSSPFFLMFDKVKKTPPQTVPPTGMDACPPSAEEVSEYVKMMHDRFFMVCAIVGIGNLILDIALNPLGYVGHVAAWIVIVAATDTFYSYTVTRSLKTINNHPLMIRRNISWVLRGYNLPFKIFSLWLVRTNPDHILAEGIAGWYQYCPEEFKEAVKLFLWITSLPNKLLPRDVALLTLEFGSVHKKKECVVNIHPERK
eukprot:TRINITY_DN25196_c0_g1_i1.p1 TRINITY_DN25196_c0_g1~~TRINITY_DN25196_c0_g1_i1.p1  ORF type:complete len:368 (+),score=35.35 TRINITY_DN25196_c0_g1_i1:45-1106(+)